MWDVEIILTVVLRSNSANKGFLCMITQCCRGTQFPKINAEVQSFS